MDCAVVGNFLDSLPCLDAGHHSVETCAKVRVPRLGLFGDPVLGIVIAFVCVRVVSRNN